MNHTTNGMSPGPRSSPLRQRWCSVFKGCTPRYWLAPKRESGIKLVPVEGDSLLHPLRGIPTLKLTLSFAATEISPISIISAGRYMTVFPFACSRQQLSMVKKFLQNCQARPWSAKFEMSSGMPPKYAHMGRSHVSSTRGGRDRNIDVQIRCGEYL